MQTGDRNRSIDPLRSGTRYCKPKDLLERGKITSHMCVSSIVLRRSCPLQRGDVTSSKITLNSYERVIEHGLEGPREYSS